MLQSRKHLSKDTTTQHSNTLKSLLRNCLLDPQPCIKTAQECLCLLCHFPKQDFLSNSWKVALELLYRQERHSEGLSFLVKTGQERLDCLLLKEMILHHLLQSEISNVLSKIETSIDIYPYSEDALIQGYAGFIYYFMWNQRIEIVESWKQDSESVRLYNLAMNYFTKSCRIWPYDFFTSLITALYMESEKMDETRQLLIDKTERDSDNPNSWKYLYTIEKQYFRNDMKWISIGEKVLELDPFSSHVLSDLVFHFELHCKEDPIVLIKCIQLIVNRLDYDYGQEWMWEKLIHFLQLSRSLNQQHQKELEFIMNERLEWWRDVYRDVDRFHHVLTFFQ